MSPLLGFGLLRKFSEPSFDGRGKSLSRVRGLERRAMFQSPSPGGRGKTPSGVRVRGFWNAARTFFPRSRFGFPKSMNRESAGLERRAMFQSPSPGGRGKSIETGQSANAKELVRCFPLILRCRLDFLGPLCDRFVRTFRDGLCREEKAFRRQVPEADIGFFTFR